MKLGKLQVHHAPLALEGGIGQLYLGGYRLTAREDGGAGVALFDDARGAVGAVAFLMGETFRQLFDRCLGLLKGDDIIGAVFKPLPVVFFGDGTDPVDIP